MEWREIGVVRDRSGTRSDVSNPLSTQRQNRRPRGKYTEYLLHLLLLLLLLLLRLLSRWSGGGGVHAA